MSKNKSELTVNNANIPSEEIPFINEVNIKWLSPKKSTMYKSGDKEIIKYNVVVDTALLAEHIKEQLMYLFVKDSSLGSALIYVYQKGYYKLISDNEFKSYIKSFIPSLIVKTKDVDEIFRNMSTDRDRYMSHDEFVRRSNEDYVNFRNGLLNLKTFELESHRPEVMSTVQLPLNYVDIDECSRGQVFEKYLNFLVNNDEVTKKCILEVMGLVLSNISGYRTKKCLLMVGPKDCGKTQIKKLLTELIGYEYTSSMELDKMNSNQFGTSELYNKRLAGSNDLKYTTVGDMGVFKQLVGGDPVSIEFKGRGAFTYTYNGFLWFLANDYPMFSGKKGNEIYERFMIVPCDNVVPKEDQDPMLVNKMLEEREYIVSLCMYHLRDLMNRNFKFIESQVMKDKAAKYEVANNNLLQFVEECCDVGDENVSIRLSDFRKNYQRWCKDVGYKAMKLTTNEIEYYLVGKNNVKLVKRSVNMIAAIKMNRAFMEDME